jgi:hypothetical protein
MDPQSNMMYLGLEGFNAFEMHNDLAGTLEGEAKSDNIVTY